MAAKRNTLIDLQGHLFDELERLKNPNLEGDKLQEELARAGAIERIGKVVVSNAELALAAQKYRDEFGRPEREMPELLCTKE